MKERILLFVKGMILGSAMIIPGLSGGTLAISMGLYEKIILTISHFFKNFKENLIFCINLGLGVVASFIICSLILNYTFEKAPIPTTLFFLGLIIGSIPMLFDKAKVKKTINISNVLFALLGIAIVFGVAFIKSNEEVIFTSFNFIQSIKLVLVGVVASATLVIPGISGSFMLMVMGYYEPILFVITDLIKFNNIFYNLLILIPFGVGVLLGVIAMVKAIEYLLKKYEIKTYYAIIGFLFASMAEVFIQLFDYNIDIIQIILGIILFAIGSFLSLKVLKS